MKLLHFKKRLLLSTALFAASASVCLSAQAPKKEEAYDPNKPVSFFKQIRPIFQSSCNGCHQPAKSKGDYIMTEFAKLLKGGEKGDAVVPKDVAKSHLIELITPDAKGKVEMPEKGEPFLVSTEDLNGWRFFQHLSHACIRHFVALSHI